MRFMQPSNAHPLILPADILKIQLAIKQQFHVIKFNFAGARSPDTRPQNPELGTRNSEPGTRNSEPRTQNQELRTMNQEPGTMNQEP